jgi:propanol-preferring alcohol dehydrogenase
MLLDSARLPLRRADVPIPTPEEDQVLVRVNACAVCRTDLHVCDGELTHPKLPLILGHEIAGEVAAVGSKVRDLTPGTRVGVPWLGYTCQRCRYCTSGRENLCDFARFTGYQIDGGYAQYAVADHRFALRLPDEYDDAHAAPLLCAGLIGYRSLRATGDAERVGIYGFGAAAHIVTQVARFEGRKVYAFTREGDAHGQQFARDLGAEWAGASTESAPVQLEAAIIFAAAGELVPLALGAVAKGGVVVCGGIHMSDIPRFPYERLWGERVVRSIANLTRKDGQEFLALAPKVPIRTEVEVYPLDQANAALDALRNGRVRGAAVLDTRS